MSLFSEDFDCLAYDRLGFGNSIAEDEPIMNAFPSDYYGYCVFELARLVDDLKLENVILVGHSDGATISLIAASGIKSNMSSNTSEQNEAADFLKSRVVAVVAESPHMWYDDTILKKGFETFINNVQSTERFWSSTMKEHQNNKMLSEKIVQRWQNMWLKNSNIHKYDDRQCLDHIKCPSLLIHGLKDPFFTEEHTKYIYNRLSKHSPSQYKLIEDAAHTPHRESKVLYNNAVLSFLKNVRPLLK
ncbi:valacyclovir hydrolase [Acrasis kona]|uniref:Valacyclovir hydrolase n=1 Tax=Acrasis kona TaxID=1008807 RepID=A0AAW2Z694_9EUKA